MCPITRGELENLCLKAKNVAQAREIKLGLKIAVGIFSSFLSPYVSKNTFFALNKNERKMSNAKKNFQRQIVWLTGFAVDYATIVTKSLASFSLKIEI